MSLAQLAKLTVSIFFYIYASLERSRFLGFLAIQKIIMGKIFGNKFRYPQDGISLTAFLKRIMIGKK